MIAYLSPTVDVLGSYFPAWMVCMLAGLALTIIVRLLLVAMKLDKYIRPGALIYPCLLALFSMVVWIAFYQN